MLECLKGLDWNREGAASYSYVGKRSLNGTEARLVLLVTTLLSHTMCYYVEGLKRCGTEECSYLPWIECEHWENCHGNTVWR